MPKFIKKSAQRKIWRRSLDPALTSLGFKSENNLNASCVENISGAWPEQGRAICPQRRRL